MGVSAGISATSCRPLRGLDLSYTKSGLGISDSLCKVCASEVLQGLSSDPNSTGVETESALYGLVGRVPLGAPKPSMVMPSLLDGSVGRLFSSWSAYVRWGKCGEAPGTSTPPRMPRGCAESLFHLGLRKDRRENLVEPRSLFLPQRRFRMQKTIRPITAMRPAPAPTAAPTIVPVGALEEDGVGVGVGESVGVEDVVGLDAVEDTESELAAGGMASTEVTIRTDIVPLEPL